MEKRYLGDAVYVDCVGDMVILTTENGVDKTNIIFLEPSVLEAFKKYLEYIKGEK